jgi:MYXO-CTERM domain-containing protein
VLGYTRLHFDPATGALYDVDIEVNAVAEPLAVGRAPQPSEADLDSILTHEVGHFLGLNHSKNVEATMVAGYQTGSLELRTPSADDIAGICAIYPPDREPTSTSCAPRRGFSELCGDEQTDPPIDGEMPGDEAAQSEGCAVIRAGAGSRRDGWIPLALLAFLTLRRRREELGKLSTGVPGSAGAPLARDVMRSSSARSLRGKALA